MKQDFNKSDYVILESLIGYKCTTSYKSLSIKFLVEICHFSHVKIRQTIKRFMIYDYIREGSKNGNTKTYYVTEEGLKHYMSVMNYDEEDIIDLIEDYENKIEKGEE